MAEMTNPGQAFTVVPYPSVSQSHREASVHAIDCQHCVVFSFPTHCTTVKSTSTYAHGRPHNEEWSCNLGYGSGWGGRGGGVRERRQAFKSVGASQHQCWPRWLLQMLHSLNCTCAGCFAGFDCTMSFELQSGSSRIRHPRHFCCLRVYVSMYSCWAACCLMCSVHGRN